MRRQSVMSSRFPRFRQPPLHLRRTRYSGALMAIMIGLGLVTLVPQPVRADTPPAQLIGLVSGNLLVQFDEASPGTIVDSTAIRGLQAGEWMTSIESRPGTGQLLGMAITDTVGPDRGRLYSIDISTGVATPTGTATVDVVEDAVRTTIDINPTVDRLRVVGSGDQSLRLNPNNGALAATDTDLNPMTLGIVNVAYDQNLPASAPGRTTTLFGISAAGGLVRIGGVNGTPSPNLGVVTAIGALGPVPDDTGVGFDISGPGTAFVSMSVAGSTGLYKVDLSTGAATLIGAIGNGLVDVTDITVVSNSVPAGAGQYSSLATAGRLLDTRLTAKLGAGDTTTVMVRGRSGVAATATAAVLNVTITESNVGGFLTVWPSGTPRPTVSSVNVDRPNQTRAALVTVRLGANGAVDINSYLAGHVIVDVIGFYAPSINGAGRLATLAPSRLLDTRNGIGTGGATTKPAAGATVDVSVLGRGGVPAANVSAVVVTLTATATTAPGFFTTHASGGVRPNASNLNASETNEDLANLAIVPVGMNGSISIYTEAGSHLLVDVVGYFASDPNVLATPRGLFVATSPTRLLDTRSGIGGLTGPVAAGATNAIQVTGVGGIPTVGVLGVSGTVTSDQGAGSGFVTALPSGTTRADTSSLNIVRAGQTVAGPIIIGLGTDGKLALFNSVATHLLTDITGFYLA